MESLTGLKAVEVAERLKRHGYNELPAAARRFPSRILEILSEPMFILLGICSGLYFVLGDLIEAILLFLSVLIVGGITFFQERKTENALQALRELASPRALVFREGRQQRIPGREVVIDDIIFLNEGDRVPADARILRTTHLMADESLLTGESVPVMKMNRSFVFSGSLVVQGEAVAQVATTGTQTEIGKIGKRLQSIDNEDTRLKREISRVVKVFASAGLLLCLAIFFIYGWWRGQWLNGALAGLTTAMSLLPEEFPVVLTIFLALGAWRMSRQNVLTRRIPAIENLGSISVLCVDKTGTLTKNQMALRALQTPSSRIDIANIQDHKFPETFHELLEYAVLANHRDPFDPMEKAIRNTGLDLLKDTEHLHADWSLVREYPLSPGLMAMSCVWRSPKGQDYCIATKGAPEAVMDLCHLGHLDSERQRKWSSLAQQLADDGYRVLGVAKAHFSETDLPGHQHDFDFELIGLLGLEDPVRPEVSQAIATCYEAGIRVIMMTGDYPGTALHVAREAGLSLQAPPLTGQELESLDEDELKTRLKTTSIVARAVPEQKLRIVRALQSSGELVSMTGDGVNDGPSLKAADIGIAMGGRGTDVARESADLVLLDDNFVSIVNGIRSGRRIFDNLKKTMVYLLAIHIPIAGMALFPVAFGLPMALLPIHIVFLELIIDPACSLAFEAEPEDPMIMKRPPRDLKIPFFEKNMILLGWIQGTIALLVVLAAYAGSLVSGFPAGQARAIGFTSLITANLGLILTNRTWSQGFFSSFFHRNKILWIVIGFAGIFLALSLFLPALRPIFGFEEADPLYLLLAGTAGFMSAIWFEFLKSSARIRAKFYVAH